MNKTRLIGLLPFLLLCCHKDAAQSRLRLQVLQWQIGSQITKPRYYQPAVPLLDHAAVAFKAWPDSRTYLALFYVQSNEVRRLWPEKTGSALCESESPATWPPSSWPSTQMFTGGPDFVLAIASPTPLSDGYCLKEGLPCTALSLSSALLWQKLNSDPACAISTVISVPLSAKDDPVKGSRNPKDDKGGPPPPPGGQRPWLELSGDVATFVQSGQDKSAPVRLCVQLSTEGPKVLPP